MPKINPFKPNYPVNPGMFVGRIQEILRLESYLFQTRADQPMNFLITGERGIGKTSLMNYVNFVARGEIPIDDTTLRFLVIDTDIDQYTTQLGLVRKIELGLKRGLAKTEPARKFLAEAWAFLTRIEAGGFRINPAERVELNEILLDEFSYSLAETVERICESNQGSGIFSAQYDGILILIDEADNASKSLDLGSFLKLLMEKLQRRTCNRIMLGLAGLPEIRNTLLESHPSSLRLFDELVLGRLSHEEVALVIRRCLEKANQDNPTETKITDEAQNLLIALSEGYPHFIQQFGYSAFAKDNDDLIDEDDVATGAFGPGGAMELIGDRYYRTDFYNRIQKESYRQVLRIMAGKLDDWVTKSEIREQFRGKESTLNNAIKALRDRRIVLSKEGERGVYRLQHKGFAVWIKHYTMDPATLQDTLELNGASKSVEGET